MSHHDPNHCARCGYPLSGLSQVCSECGFETDLEPPARHEPGPLDNARDGNEEFSVGLFLLLAALLNAICLACIVASRGAVAFAREWQAGAVLVGSVFTVLCIWWRFQRHEEGTLSSAAQMAASAVLAAGAATLLLYYAV